MSELREGGVKSPTTRPALPDVPGGHLHQPLVRQATDHSLSEWRRRRQLRAHLGRWTHRSSVCQVRVRRGSFLARRIRERFVQRYRVKLQASSPPTVHEAQRSHAIDRHSVVFPRVGGYVAFLRLAWRRPPHIALDLHLLVVVLIALRLCSDVFADVIYRFANELTASTKGGRENIGVRLDALVVLG